MALSLPLRQSSFYASLCCGTCAIQIRLLLIRLLLSLESTSCFINRTLISLLYIHLILHLPVHQFCSHHFHHPPLLQLDELRLIVSTESPDTVGTCHINRTACAQCGLLKCFWGDFFHSPIFLF